MPQFRIKGISQSVAEKVGRKGNEHDADTRAHNKIHVASHELSPFRQDGSPFRDGRLRAQSDKA